MSTRARLTPSTRTTAFDYVSSVQTYRQSVCPIVLPNLQQRHHHLVKFISRQNPVVVHIEHLKAD